MKRDLIIVMAGRVLQMALLLLTLRAMTTRLSPTEVGNFSLLTSISTLFVWILISPIGLYVNRHILDWKANGTVWINTAREIAYVAVVAVFSSIVLFVWQAIFEPAWAMQLSWLGSAMAAYIFFSVANQTVIPAANLFGRRLLYTTLYIATQTFCLGFSWIFATFGAKGEYWFLGQAAGFAVGFLFALPPFLSMTSSRQTITRPQSSLRERLNDVSTFALPISVSWGLIWVQFQSYRIMIGNLVSLEFLGLFFAGYSVSAGVMGAVEITAGQFFGPYFYKHIQEAKPEQQHDAWAAYMSTIYPIMMVIVIVMIALAEPIAHILLNHKFWSASAFVAVGAIVEGVRVMAGTYALAAHVTKRTHVLLLPHMVGGISISIFLLGGTWLFGERAVAPAMILSALIFLTTMHITMLHHSGSKLSIFGSRWVACVAAILTGIWFVKPHVPLYAGLTNFGLIAIGAVIILGAFFLILRDAQAVLSQFAK